VSICRSPPCEGEVIVETATDGHCLACGLQHHRRAGSAAWGQVIGPLVVTLRLSAGESDGEVLDHEVLDADALRFAGRYMTIDATHGGARFQTTVPAARLIRIDPRD
jgi:hypothetical protein